MSTTKTQRIGLWIIAVFLAIGTIGSFAIIVLANQNAQQDQARINTLEAAYEKDQKEYQDKVTERNMPYTDAAKLSAQYYDEFSQYQSRVAAFNKDDVTKLEKNELKEGSGATLESSSEAVVYYIGWNPEGKVFDGSIEDGALKAPFVVQPGRVIEGWSQGLVGMKEGGVRELSIPSDLAYGAQGGGEDIPADTPLKFVVMVIAKLDSIAEPEIPEALINYYQTGRVQ